MNILNIYSVPECTGYIIFNLHSNYADLELLKTSSRSTEHANLIKLTWYLLSSRKWPFFKRTRITVSQVALLVLTNRFPNKCNTNRYPLCHAYSTIKAASWKIKGNFDSIPCVNSYEETIFMRFQVERKECKLESQLSHKKSAAKAFLHTLTFILLHSIHVCWTD